MRTTTKKSTAKKTVAKKSAAKKSVKTVRKPPTKRAAKKTTADNLAAMRHGEVTPPEKVAKKTVAKKAARRKPRKRTTKKAASVKRTYFPKPSGRHFAIGLPVRIRDGALPVDWTREWSNIDPDELYSRSYPIKSTRNGSSETTFEVADWHWSPEDLQIDYR